MSTDSETKHMNYHSAITVYVYMCKKSYQNNSNKKEF